MRPFQKIRRIDNIIVKNDHLNALQDKVTHLISLKKRILSTLCEPAPCDFTVIEFAQTTLKLSVNQAGFASRLRFLAPDWVQQLRQADPEFWRYLAQIKIQISPGKTALAPNLTGQTACLDNILTRNNPRPKSKQNRDRPQPLIDAKTLLSSQEVDENAASETGTKSATSSPLLPIKAKSHRLRQLIYESSEYRMHMTPAQPQNTSPSTTARYSFEGKRNGPKVGLKPDPLTDCLELNDALDRLWQNVYPDD